MHHRSHDQAGLPNLTPWMQTPPLDTELPWTQTPWIQTPLDANPHGILQDTVNKWTVRILLECILVTFGLQSRVLLHKHYPSNGKRLTYPKKQLR